MTSRIWRSLVVMGSMALVAATSLAVRRAVGSLSVTPDGQSGGMIDPNTSGYVASFNVSYPGDELDPTETFSIWCSGTLGISCSPSQSSVMLNPNSSVGIDVTFSTSSAVGMGTVTLTVAGQTTGLFDTGSYSYQVGEAAGSLGVTPDDAASGTISTNTSGHVASYTVAYSGNALDPTETFNLSCSATLGISCSVSQSSVTLAPNNSSGIDVTFSTSSSQGTGYVYLHVDGQTTGLADNGSRSYQVGTAAGNLAVTPDDASSGGVNPSTNGYVANFSVGYSGNELDPTETFNLWCSATLGISCWVSQSSVVLIPNSSAGIDVTFNTSTSTGTGYVSLFASGQTTGLSDSGSRYYQIGPPVTVAPVSVPSSVLQHTQDVTATFSVHNGTGVTHTYQLTCEWGAGPCSAPPSISVSSSGTQNVQVTFDVGVIPAPTTLKLTATDGGDSDFDAEILNVGEYVSVNAVAQRATVYAVPGAARTDTFVVRFPDQAAASFAMSVSCPGAPKANACSVNPADQTLSVGDTPVKVRVNYTAGVNNDTSNVTLTATKTGAAFPVIQSGALRVVSTNSLLLNVSDANPGLEYSFAECLNISAGVGAIVCDNFEYAYVFPPVVRRNVPRQIALIYNSAMRAPQGVLGANFVLPPGVTEPSSIAATLKINGSTVRTQTYGSSLYAPGEQTRIAFDWFGTGAGADRKLLNYEVTLTPTGQSPVTRTGKFVSLDTNDRYGAGWWIAGLEALVVQGDTLVWTGSDGSARAYFKSGTRWIAQTRGRPDTIVSNGTGYSRKIIGGGEVRFDTVGTYGMHARTISVNGDTTYFDHTLVGSLRRLTSIRVGANDTIFRIRYNASTSGIDSVFVRSDGTGWDKWKVNTAVADGTLRLTSIVAPDATTTSFLQQTSGSNSGRLDWIARPGGDTTKVTYLSQMVTTIQLDTVASGVAVTLGYLPGSTIGRATSAGWQAPKPVDSLSSRFDGPLPIAADTTRFFTTGWGAVRGIRDHKGAATWIDRQDAAYASFPTRVRSPNGHEMIASYFHDGVHDGLLQSVLDRTTGALTSYRWNETHSKPDTILSPEGVRTTLRYDAKGNLIGQKVASDSVIYVFNSSGLVTSMKDPEGHQTTYGYDSRLNLSSETTPVASIWTHFLRDARGLPKRVTRPFGTGSDSTIVTTSYDVFGRDSVVRTTNNTNAAWLEVRHTYNANGLRTKTASFGGLTASENDSTGVSQWFFDKLGRVRVSQTPVSSEIMTYDAAGNVLTQANGAATITMTYDTLSRLTRRIVPARTWPAETWALDTFPAYTFPHYAPSGLTIPADTTRFTYDPMGRMLTATDRDTRITRTYALNGSLETDSLALKNYEDALFTLHGYKLTYHYDRDGRRVAIDHPAWLSPGSDRTSYQFDGTTGRLSSVSDPMGSTWQFVYNRNGQPKRITYPAGQDTIGYDALGRVSSVFSVIGGYLNEAIAYDKASRITSGGGVGGGSSFTYNAFGHLDFSQVSHAAGSVKQFFDTDVFGNVVFNHDYPPGFGPQDHPGTADSVNYFANGVLLNSRIEKWVYTGHPATPTHFDPGTTQQSYDRGNTTMSWTRQPRQVPIGQFAAYDSVRTMALDDSRTKSYYTADDKLVVVQVTRDSIWYQYDALGNLLFEHRTDTWGAYEEYWYDALGRRVLKRTRQEAPLCTYFQGPVGTPGRCFSATERYVWDGDQLLWEMRALGTDEQYPGPDAQAGVIGYTHVGGIDQPVGMVRNGETIVLHRGWRGLYVSATDTAGHAVGTTPPVPWPGVSWEVQGRFIDPRITHEWVGSLPMGLQDETGLRYQRNRYYDAASGRFTQQDPIGIAGGLNLYGYANGDPINFSDPFGLCPWCLVGYAAGGVAAGITEGYLITKALGGDYSLGAAFVDGTLGAVGGLAAGIGHLRRLARIGSAGNNVADAGQGVRATVHGAERLADASRLGPDAARGVMDNATRRLTQGDGANVFIQEVDGAFNVVVSGERGIITTFKHLDEGALERLGRNYDWH